MKKGRLILAILLFLTPWGEIASVDAQEALREWTSTDGRKVRAQLSGFQDAETVILKLEDGRSVNLPIGKLSTGDVAYAKERYKGNPGDGSAPAASPTAVDWSKPVQSTEYVIRGVKRATVPGYISVKSGWEYGIRCVEARLEYKGSMNAAPATVKAYYYNRDGQLIEKFDRVPRRQNDDRVYVTAPEFFPKGDTVEVYYPITDFHETSNLATVLIVFGNDTQFSVATLPTASLAILDFEEKQHLFPGWEPSKSATGSASAPIPGLSLEIRRVRQEKHRFSVIFNGDYEESKPVVAAEVRALGTTRPGDGEVTLYAYDANGKRVGFRERPSTAEIGGSTYVGVPKIANDDWHPVFFALDGDLTKEPPTYVVVFQYGGKTTAAVVSSNGATLESLDFPEKSQLEK
jgi:hypothetical protein